MGVSRIFGMIKYNRKTGKCKIAREMHPIPLKFPVFSN
jgi:hypothetical protein